MKSAFSSILLASALAVIVGAIPASAGETGKATIEQLVRLFPQLGKNKAVLNSAADEIDYQSMTQMLFKPAQWSKLGNADKQQIVAEFRKLVERRYYPRWQKMFSRGKLSIGKETRSGGDTFVTSSLSKPGSKQSDTIIWRLRPSGSGFNVVSVDVNGKDLIARLSPRFQKAFEKKGASGVIAWMKNRGASAGADADQVN